MFYFFHQVNRKKLQCYWSLLLFFNYSSQYFLSIYLSLPLCLLLFFRTLNLYSPICPLFPPLPLFLSLSLFFFFCVNLNINLFINLSDCLQLSIHVSVYLSLYFTVISFLSLSSPFDFQISLHPINLTNVFSYLHSLFSFSHFFVHIYPSICFFLQDFLCLLLSLHLLLPFSLPPFIPSFRI